MPNQAIPVESPPERCCTEAVITTENASPTKTWMFASAETCRPLLRVRVSPRARAQWYLLWRVEVHRLSGMALAAGLLARPFPDVLFFRSAPAASALRLSFSEASVVWAFA